MSSRTSSDARSRSPLDRKHHTPKRSNQQEESPPGYGSSVSASESTFGSPSRERISKSIICNLDLPVARVKSMIKVNLNNQHFYH